MPGGRQAERIEAESVGDGSLQPKHEAVWLHSIVHTEAKVLKHSSLFSLRVVPVAIFWKNATLQVQQWC